ncbi:hypothetical protein [Ruminococcus sp. XPD3002]|uniref:hypothetical protein n=1 Tax=Ruminococcus sp. XPD3002 TaxID=1452269 RepID=UPI00091CD317|nr:hypothetical protein SAMN04487832_11634 [Ruminococcus flavefaciens]
MKNPMIENNINAELFEAIDENAVNGGLKLTLRHSAFCFITPPITPNMVTIGCAATTILSTKICPKIK